MATVIETTYSAGKEILYNSHYVAVPRVFTNAEATAGVVAAGTILADGVCLHDVVVADNPNGALVVHGFIDCDKLTTQPTVEQVAALPMIKFVGYVPEDPDDSKEN